MKVIFNDGTELMPENFSLLKNRNKWELFMSFRDNLTLEQLDRIITPTNLTTIRVQTTESDETFTGYTKIETLEKLIGDFGVCINIILLKEDEENESQI